MKDGPTAAPTDRFLDTRDQPDGQAKLAREIPLLLHSVQEFAQLVGPLIAAVEPRCVVEIGGETGDAALAYLEAGAPEVVCVDPAPTRELRDRAAAEQRLGLVEARSPECIPDLPPSAFWVIDGDHNYATVHAELEAILDRSDPAEPPLVLVHDVLWPCARRDFYYDPEALVGAGAHPHRWDLGPSIASQELRPDGLVGRGQYAVAKADGGEGNGVRTAVEDVLASRTGLRFAIVPAVYGLGVVYPAGAPWAGAVAELLAPWDRSPFLTRLELNRIALYCRVLELQEELAKHSPTPGDRLR